MKLFAFSVYDSAVGTYSPPFFVRAGGLAIRDFRFEIANPESRLSKSPGDYSLFCMGEFDDETATFSLFEAPRRVMTGLDALKVKEVPDGEA